MRLEVAEVVQMMKEVQGQEEAVVEEEVAHQQITDVVCRSRKEDSGQPTVVLLQNHAFLLCYLS